VQVLESRELILAVRPCDAERATVVENRVLAEISGVHGGVVAVAAVNPVIAEAADQHVAAAAALE